MRSGGKPGRRDPRGNNAARRARKLQLLAIYGDGETCDCVWCGCELTVDTLTQDRIRPGGLYVIENLQPACLFCNQSRGNRETPRTLRTVELVAA